MRIDAISTVLVYFINDRGNVRDTTGVCQIVVVEDGRLPINEGVVKDIMATISAGDVSVASCLFCKMCLPGETLDALCKLFLENRGRETKPTLQ
jgi:hypothetical protein